MTLFNRLSTLPRSLFDRFLPWMRRQWETTPNTQGAYRRSSAFISGHPLFPSFPTPSLHPFHAISN